MQSTRRMERNGKIIVLAENEHYRNRAHHGKKKLSRIMAMLLGVVVTLELMVIGAMVLNIDVHSADRIALVLGFVVLYFGVVAGLTDK